jgi:hypothetical protein
MQHALRLAACAAAEEHEPTAFELIIKLRRIGDESPLILLGFG